MLQDWCSLHRYILRRAVSFAVLKTNEKFDADNQHIFLQVSYRPDCDGNPAMAFVLVGGEIEDDPAPNTPEGRNLESFKATTRVKNAEMRAEDPDLMSWVRCMSQYSTRLPSFQSLIHHISFC